MATQNKVFVSPGVYTSELDLTFVAQSVGVTTLGVVGETLKGPAFEPILIGSYDEFKTYFGGTSPEKDGPGNPKYELPYVAKAYLQESNQLFVTRVLGKTGYKPFNTFGIQTIGGMTVDLATYATASSVMDPRTLTGMTNSGFYTFLSDKISTGGLTITEYIQQTYSGNTTSNIDDWFTIGNVPTSATSGLTGNQLVSPIGEYNNKNWYNVFTNGVDEVYSYLFIFHDAAGDFSFHVTKYTYDATVNSDYDGVVVAALRPRGRYSNETLILEVTDEANFELVDGNGVETNPLGEFTINVTGTTVTGGTSFTCSMDESSPKFISKVLGNEVFDKSHETYPLYVHELYSKFLLSAYQRGYVRGLSLTPVYNEDVNNFLTSWDTTMSPTVVSEVRGGKVTDLFSFQTVSDGNSANKQIKVTIQNINIETGEFDVVLRDFYDTDDNMVILEKFTRCSMNSDLPGYVARKIGTSDGEYSINSKYVSLILADGAPTDAIPAGFKGFATNSSFGSNNLGGIVYKTEYLTAGDVLYYDADGTPNLSNGDKVKRVMLGLSSQIASTYDEDLFMYKGDPNVVIGETHGFHLSTNASTITGTTYQTTPYDLEGTDKGLLTNSSYCKFTFAFYGGFDGWDIYRNQRTNSDGYIYGKNTYISGKTINGGVFNKDYGNSDYYAYLEGIQTYSNPEAIDINLFATPGINFYNHSSLVNQAIDMVENDRADSLYIIGAPGPVDTNSASDAVDNLDLVNIDSNYSATYWPWIQVRDTDNATQLYLPPTAEVVKNIALTDNVSYPWFAPAGYSRGIVNSIKAFKKLTLDERDSLYKGRINPIATFSDTGTIIWGNKTLQVRESALDRINVRRLLLRARKLISAVAVRLLFEQNDDQVRQEFLRLVNPILESIKKERGLYEFKVTVSNDPEDIDANTLRGKIYVKPTRSLEFIDLEFIITPTGASFENI